MEAFERLINQVPEESEVLDVGAGGHSGVNTSLFLIQRFKKYVGMNNKTNEEITKFCGDNNQAIVIADYWEQGGAQYDLLVLDMNIDNNFRNWSDDGLTHAKKCLRKGGYMICYIMVTDNYGNPETPAQLREHRDKWWGSWDKENIVKKLKNLDGFTFIALEQEERRPEIYWSLLKYE